MSNGGERTVALIARIERLYNQPHRVCVRQRSKVKVDNKGCVSSASTSHRQPSHIAP